MGYFEEVLADSPLVYLRLDEPTPGTGTAVDYSGNGNNATYAASPTSVPGLLAGDPGRCVDFNGSTQWANSAVNMFPTLSQRTLEAWVWRRTQATADAMIASDRATNRVLWALNSATDTVAWFPDSGTASVTWANALTVGQIGHLVLTFDGSTKAAELWVNGISKGSLTATVDYAGNANYQVANSGAGGNPFDGRLDEVAIYNGILAPGRIQAHYAIGSNPLKFSPDRMPMAV